MKNKENAILKSLMKNNFLFNASFCNKICLAFVCNPYSEKESLKIRNVNSKIVHYM